MRKVRNLDAPEVKEMGVAVLDDVAKLLDGPEKWTQRVYARTESGRAVSYTHPDGVCFCLSGALEHVRVTHLDAVGGSLMPVDDERVHTILDAHYIALATLVSCLPEPWRTLTYFNDQHGRTYGEVIGVVQCAQKKARENV